MAEYEDIRTGEHRVFALHTHLVFVTKFRGEVFIDTPLNRMEEIMRDVRADFEIELREFNGESDHVHPPVNSPPKIAPSKLVNSVKGVSSPRTRREFPEPARHYRRATKPWSGSYFAGSVGGAPTRVPRSTSSGRTVPVRARSGPRGAFPRGPSPPPA